MIRVRAGDRAAYEGLYARWKDPTFRFLVRRTGARAQAEEAHQEAWLRVYRFRAGYDPTRPFRSWLYTIAANCGRDAVKPELPVFALPLEPNDPADLRDRLVGALMALDPGDRRLILLAAEGFDGPEIAEMLGIGAGAVRMRLHRARQRMREAVDAEDPGGADPGGRDPGGPDTDGRR